MNAGLRQTRMLHVTMRPAWEEDREAKLGEIAKMTQQQALTVRQHYEADPGRMGQLEALILQDKILDFILGQAKIAETADK